MSLTYPVKQSNAVETWLSSSSTLAQFKAALPSHFAPDRMARLGLTQLRTVRGLADCSQASIMACIMQAAQLGLEPGVLGSCYLIPRKGEATFLIGYQGLLDLIRRSGKVTSIASRVVYESDTFEIDYAAAVPFTHRPDLRRTVDRILGFYTHAILSTGEHVFEWMPLHEVQAIRGRSQSGNSGPWATDFAEMGKKTVLRRAAKYLPRSIEFSDAIAAEDHVEYGTPAPALEVQHVEVRPTRETPASPVATVKMPPPPPSATASTSAKKATAPKAPAAVVEAVQESFSPSYEADPDVVPFEDDGFPL